MLDESQEEKSQKKKKKLKMPKQNPSQIVDLVESSKTVPTTPRNSEKKCIFGPLKVSTPFSPNFHHFPMINQVITPLSRLKSIVKVVEKRLHPNFRPKRIQKTIFLVTSKIVIRAQETCVCPEQRPCVCLEQRPCGTTTHCGTDRLEAGWMNFFTSGDIYVRHSN